MAYRRNGAGYSARLKFRSILLTSAFLAVFGYGFVALPSAYGGAPPHSQTITDTPPADAR